MATKSPERRAYERILLGSVAKCFGVIRLMLAARFKDMGIPETAQKIWNTQRLGPARGFIREVTFQTFHVTHKGTPERRAYERILLGPVAKCFAVIRLMLAARFKDKGIPETAQKWTTKADPSGTPEILGVSTKDIRLAVVFVPGDGVNIQTQRLRPARGFIKKVTFQTFNVTYKGFIPGEKSTTLLYGSG